MSIAVILSSLERFISQLKCILISTFLVSWYFIPAIWGKSSFQFTASKGLCNPVQCWDTSFYITVKWKNVSNLFTSKYISITWVKSLNFLFDCVEGISNICFIVIFIYTLICTIKLSCDKMLQFLWVFLFKFGQSLVQRSCF